MKTKNNRNQNQQKADSYKTEIPKRTGDVTARSGQAYVRPEYHDRISEIIALSGEDGMTVEDYPDNVLTEHFAQCQDAVEALLDRENAHRHRNRYHDARHAKRPSSARPVKGYVQEITPADAEELLSGFLEASEIKTRQCVYIDRETHGKISGIVKYLGKGVSIGKFVDNVLRDHINRHRVLYSIALGNVKPMEL